MHSVFNSTSDKFARFRPGTIPFALAALLALASPAWAQDKATLDLLVKKGVITQADADSVAKSAAIVVVTPRDKAVKALKFEGMIQAQYDWLTTKDNLAGNSNPTGTNEFELRRVHLGAAADLGNGWGGEILLDLGSPTSSSEPNSGPQAAAPAAAGTTNQAIGQNLFEKVMVTKKFDDLDATLGVGFRKVDFTQEEITSSSDLKVIERSVVSRYFDEAYGNPTSRRIGFANRHTGIFWSGTLPTLLDGFYYSAALTNGVQNANIQYTNAPAGTTSAGGLNKFAGWVALGYKGKARDVGYDAGVNLGVSADQNSQDAGVSGALVNQSNTEWGYNPYVRLDYGQFELAAEFEQVSVDNGRGTVGAPSRAAPYGYNITGSYKITPEWELAARYSVLSTNGRGTNISDVVRDGVNVTDSSSVYFNNVSSYYVGVNWYIIGTSLKVQGGYEFDKFTDRGPAAGGSFTGAGASVQGLRAELQLVF